MDISSLEIAIATKDRLIDDLHRIIAAKDDRIAALELDVEERRAELWVLMDGALAASNASDAAVADVLDLCIDLQGENDEGRRHAQALEIALLRAPVAGRVV